MLYSLTILPIITFMEFIFSKLVILTNNFALSIILLSCIVNFILIPVFKWADKIKDKEVLKKAKFEGEIAKIKAVFKGREAYYYTKEVYRRYNYHPISSLFTLLPLFIQIPIFISAFQFLSNYNFENEFLQNSDGILFGLNFLPFIMTGINILSSIIYANKMKDEEKLQLLIIAGLFFVLLYNSPSSLLIYWITSNIFSLIKNSISFKLQSPKLSLITAFNLGFSSLFKTLAKYQVFIVSFCLFLSFYFILNYFAFAGRHVVIKTDGVKLSIFTSLLTFFIILPRFWKNNKILYSLIISFFIFGFYRLFFVFNFYDPYGVQNFRILCFSITLIAFFMALAKYRPKILQDKARREIFYPSLLFSIFTFLVFNPIIIFAKSTGYQATMMEFFSFIIISSFAIALFFTILFELSKKSIFGKILLNIVLFISISGIINSFLFIKDYGMLNGYSIDPIFFIEKEMGLWLLDCIIFFILCFYGIAFLKKQKVILYSILAIFFVISFGKTLYALFQYKPQEFKIQTIINGDLPSYNNKAMSYSKNGKNIIVFFVDALSGDEMFEIEKRNPEIIAKFDGFTNYINTLAVTSQTHSSIPAMFGGHDFTPASPIFQNKEGGSIVDKTDKAYESFFKNMNKEKADVTLVDVEMSNKRCNLNDGKFNCVHSTDYNSFYLSKNEVKIFSLPKSLEVPLFFQMLSVFNSLQMIFQKKQSRIMNDIFGFPEIDKVSIFANLPEISSIEEGSETKVKYLYTWNVHLSNIMDSECKVASSLYLAKHSMEENYYQSTKCTFIFMARFIDWLKENKIYDNTKIIIVSDHGIGFKSKYADAEIERKVEKLNQAKDFTYRRTIATLMVKDYNERGDYKKDTRLMSNSDVPAIICSGLSPSCSEYYKDPIKNNINRKSVKHYSVREITSIGHLFNTTPTYKILAEIEVTGDLYKKENVKVKDFQ